MSSFLRPALDPPSARPRPALGPPSARPRPALGPSSARPRPALGPSSARPRPALGSAWMLLDLRTRAIHKMVQQLRCLTDDDDDYLSPQRSTGMTKTDADRWVTIKFDLSQLYGIMRVDLLLFYQPDRSFYSEVKDIQLERCTSICKSSARHSARSESKSAEPEMHLFKG